jgi:hypothetical protein
VHDGPFGINDTLARVALVFGFPPALRRLHGYQDDILTAAVFTARVSTFSGNIDPFGFCWHTFSLLTLNAWKVYISSDNFPSHIFYFDGPDDSKYLFGRDRGNPLLIMRCNRNRVKRVDRDIRRVVDEMNSPFIFIQAGDPLRKRGEECRLPIPTYHPVLHAILVRIVQSSTLAFWVTRFPVSRLCRDTRSFRVPPIYANPCLTCRTNVPRVNPIDRVPPYGFLTPPFSGWNRCNWRRCSWIGVQYNNPHSVGCVAPDTSAAMTQASTACVENTGLLFWLDFFNPNWSRSAAVS